MHSFRTTTLLLALVAGASSLSATTANASLDEVMAIRGHQNMRARRNTVNSIVSNHGSALRRKRLTQAAQELAARQADDASSSSASASETASGTTSVNATATSTGATSSGTTSTATGTASNSTSTGISTGTGTATSTSVVATTTATFDTVGEDTEDYADEDDEDDDSTTTTSSAASTSSSSTSTSSSTTTKKHHHHHSSSSSAATATATTSTKKKSSKKNKSCKTKSTNSNLVATDDDDDDTDDSSSSSASGSSSTKTSATATSTKASSSGSSSTSSAATATGTGLLSGASDITEDGEITYFAVGLGACGYTDTDSDYIAALPVGLWNSIGGADVWEGNIVCNKKIMISKGDTVITVTVRDQCPTCADNHLDLSPSAFKALAPLVEGEVSVSWGWIGGVPT